MAEAKKDDAAAAADSKKAAGNAVNDLRGAIGHLGTDRYLTQEEKDGLAAHADRIDEALRDA